MAAVTLGLGARSLRDTDYFSKSDPFVVVSRPNLSGGFEIIRQSETKNNTLNPDWKDFYFTVDEICNGDTTLNIKFEVYDDDGKKGLDSKDKLIGQGFFSLKHLESAYNVHSNLTITDGKNKNKNKGSLVVRTFKYHNSPTVVQNNSVGVGHVPASSGGYPQPGGQHGRPPYQSPVAGYPGGAGMYSPGSTGGYPGGAPQAGGYPGAAPQTGGYPSAGQPMSQARPDYHMNNMGGGIPGGYPPAQHQPSFAGYPNPQGAPGGGYPGAPGGGFPGALGGSNPGAGHPGYPGGHPSAPCYPNAPGGGYPSAPGGGFAPAPGSAYPGGQNVGGGGLFPESNLPAGPGYR